MKRMLAALMDTLTKRQRQIIEMYYSGKNITEIADVLKVNKSTVHRTLMRAIKNIKKNKELIEKVAR